MLQSLPEQLVIVWKDAMNCKVLDLWFAEWSPHDGWPSSYIDSLVSVNDE
jgi:hypothetical protein